MLSDSSSSLVQLMEEVQVLIYTGLNVEYKSTTLRKVDRLWYKSVFESTTKGKVIETFWIGNG